MTDLVPVSSDARLPAPASAALTTNTPDIEELFGFARDAELRVRSLRMSIDERATNSLGTELIRHEVLLRHPGLARVTSSRDDDPMSSDYDIWISDGASIRTYDARHKLASVRARRTGVVGPGGSGLPAYARTYDAVTPLAPGSMADTFIHPHGLFRNVMLTGPLAVVGTRTVMGREAIVVAVEHPRSAKVLVDRPDHSLEVGIDRATGFLLFLTEQVGDVITQEVEVAALSLDPDIPDSAFELHLSSDVRTMF